MQQQLGPPPMNPISRLLAGLVAAMALVAAFFFGLFVLAVVVAVGLVAWLVFWLRLKWLANRMERNGFPPSGGFGEGEGPARGEAARSGSVIDAEYEVVDRGEED